MADWAIDPSLPPALFSVGEAQNMLRRTGAYNSDDTKMVGYFAASVTPIIEDIIGGPVVQRTVVDDVPARSDASGRSVITLPRTPVVSITSLAAQQDGILVPDVATLRISPFGDVFSSNYVLMPSPVRVTYVAGLVDSLAKVPANVKLAALAQFQWLWQFGQQAIHPGFDGGDAPDQEWTPSGFAVSRYVMQLLSPNDQIAGIA